MINLSKEVLRTKVPNNEINDIQTICAKCRLEIQGEVPLQRIPSPLIDIIALIWCTYVTYTQKRQFNFAILTYLLQLYLQSYHPFEYPLLFGSLSGQWVRLSTFGPVLSCRLFNQSMYCFSIQLKVNQNTKHSYSKLIDHYCFDDTPQVIVKLNEYHNFSDYIDTFYGSDLQQYYSRPISWQCSMQLYQNMRDVLVHHQTYSLYEYKQDANSIIELLIKLLCNIMHVCVDLKNLNISNPQFQIEHATTTTGSHFKFNIMRSILNKLAYSMLSIQKQNQQMEHVKTSNITYPVANIIFDRYSQAIWKMLGKYYFFYEFNPTMAIKCFENMNDGPKNYAFKRQKYLYLISIYYVINDIKKCKYYLKKYDGSKKLPKQLVLGCPILKRFENVLQKFNLVDAKHFPDFKDIIFDTQEKIITLKNTAMFKECQWKQCLTKSLVLKKCRQCKSVYYCSRICQKKDWQNHRQRCSRLNARDYCMTIEFT